MSSAEAQSIKLALIYWWLDNLVREMLTLRSARLYMVPNAVASHIGTQQTDYVSWTPFY